MARRFHPWLAFVAMARPTSGDRPGSTRSQEGGISHHGALPEPGVCNGLQRRGQYAGKKARCAECGTLTRIPGGRAEATVRSRTERPARAASRSQATRAPAAAPECACAPNRRGEVRIGCIGRGHAGKTALFQALGDSLVGDFLPSGLHLDAADPREVARMIREAEEAAAAPARVRPAADAARSRRPATASTRGTSGGWSAGCAR